MVSLTVWLILMDISVTRKGRVWSADCSDNMSSVILEEIRLFLLVLAMGMLLAFSYDVLRIFRAVKRHDRWLVDGEDILFWLVWLLIIIDFLYYRYHGSMRGYVILAMTVGIIVYEGIFSKYIVHIVTFVISKVLKLLCIPLQFMQGSVKKLTRFLKKVTIKSRKLLGKRGDSHEAAKKGCVPKKETTK